jgi:hypothetical protein
MSSGAAPNLGLMRGSLQHWGKWVTANDLFIYLFIYLFTIYSFIMYQKLGA